MSVCAELVDPSDGLETNVSLEITAEYKDNTMNVPLTFAAGSQVGAMECFNVSIMDNGIFEDDSMITLMSQSEQNRVEILNDTVVIMVLDDESEYICRVKHKLWHVNINMLLNKSELIIRSCICSSRTHSRPCE